MPNFRKVSRFDEGDLPPEDDYPDWKKSDTKVLTVMLAEDQFADVELRRLKAKYTVVEELVVGMKADNCGKLIVRVLKGGG